MYKYKKNINKKVKDDSGIKESKNEKEKKRNGKQTNL